MENKTMRLTTSEASRLKDCARATIKNAFFCKKINGEIIKNRLLIFDDNLFQSWSPNRKMKREKPVKQDRVGKIYMFRDGKKYEI